jgi:hypothetical protein
MYKRTNEMNWDCVMARLSEPSTWAGLASILGGAAVGGLGVDTWTTVIGAGMAVAGAIGVIKKDKGW